MKHDDPDLPELPPVYELVRLERTGDILAETADRARAGAEEGTLVWALAQDRGRGRAGQRWFSPPGSLHAGVVLRPEFDFERSGELALVGAVALGGAIAELVTPMTELRYRWPSKVMVGATRIAGLWLRRDPGANWLALAFSVNVRERPEEVFDGGCLCEEGGNPEITPGLLLEGFARQFLAWINRWAEEGLEPVARQFRGRWEETERSLALILPGEDERVTGIAEAIDDHGALIVNAGDERRRITINEFLDLP